MRVLLVGSGGREHTLATILARSPVLTSLFAAPGNPGMAELARLVPLSADDCAGLVDFALKEKIDLVIPGPEAPLVAGLANACQHAGIACAGPTQQAAQLEGSKRFTREIADATGIPSAKWDYFDGTKGRKMEDALAFIARHGAPIVVKADGLAAGKGVIVAQSLEEAEHAVRQLGLPLVIEECLTGQEVSLFAFCADEKAVLIGAARDHKRLGDGDTGPNTGGMGAICPPPDFDRDAQQDAVDKIVRPMLVEMKRRGMPFRGIIFAGLMLTEDGPKLIEYNVRLGDPEAQALLIRLQSDLLPVLAGLARGELPQEEPVFSDQPSLSLVLAARGYPDAPKKGGVITGLERVAALPDVFLFHCGTKEENGQILANGGRVLSIAATGRTAEKARARAYEAAATIQWADKILRSDIGR